MFIFSVFYVVLMSFKSEDLFSLISVSAISGWVSNSAFVSLVDVSISIA